MVLRKARFDGIWYLCSFVLSGILCNNIKKKKKKKKKKKGRRRRRKEGNVLFNQALNTFYLRL